MSKLKETAAIGQAVWLDYIRRTFIHSGEMARLAAQGARGVTSNPSIFKQAIAGSDDYDEQMAQLVAEGLGVNEIYEALVIEDIRSAADVFATLYEESNRADGFVSLEVNPHLAHDAEGSINEALRLFETIGRPNTMIKVPATPEGVVAVEALIGKGVNVNVTLIFSLSQYKAVAKAYIAGIEKLVAAGGDPAGVSSVASFFVSRIDTAVDAQLEALGNSELQGKAAIDSARLAYGMFKEFFSTGGWKTLADKGALVQRPLWASTGIKNPAYSDILYVDSLIGPDTVNTLPPATLEAFMDHGTPASTIEDDLGGAGQRMEALANVDINLDSVTDKLLVEGLKSFADAFDELIESVKKKRKNLLTGRVALDTALGEYSGAVDQGLAKLADHKVLERLWERDHTLWSPTPEEVENRLGWLDLATTMRPAVGEIDNLRRELMGEGYEKALLIGMGGSSLAPEVLAQTFPEVVGLGLLVIDSTVPQAISNVEKKIDLARTLFIVSTKSGGTVETLSLFKYFYNKVSQALGEETAGRNFIAITDPGSSLEATARRLGFRATFLNDPNIGGRYAAMSLVGLVPGGLMGIELNELLDSLEDAVENASAQNDPVEGDNRAAILGAVLGALALGGRDKVTFAISEQIASLGDWIEQLIAESTGKDGKGILPVVGEKLGPPPVYGDDRLFVSITMEGDDSFEARLGELAAAGHPVVRLQLGSAFEVGEQFFLWEAATAIAGWFLGIHPFNQPDVESAKVEAREAVANFKNTGTLDIEPPSLEVGGVAVYGEVGGADPLEVLDNFLAGTGPGDYVALQAYVERNDATDHALAKLRDGIRQRTRAAVTVGYGPRFLHSTGQLHKGDAGRGCFIQFTCEDSVELMIPDEAGAAHSSLGFGVLKMAQAVGDGGALEKNGRRVVRFHFSSDPAAGIAGLV